MVTVIRSVLATDEYSRPLAGVKLLHYLIGGQRPRVRIRSVDATDNGLSYKKVYFDKSSATIDY